jgi:hypothetical protein
VATKVDSSPIGRGSSWWGGAAGVLGQHVLNTMYCAASPPPADTNEEEVSLATLFHPNPSAWGVHRKGCASIARSRPTCNQIR